MAKIKQNYAIYSEIPNLINMRKAMKIKINFQRYTITVSQLVYLFF